MRVQVANEPEEVVECPRSFWTVTVHREGSVEEEAEGR